MVLVANLYLNRDSVVLIVRVRRIRQFDVSGSDVAGRRKFNTLLGTMDRDGVAKLKRAREDRYPSFFYLRMIIHVCE